MAITRINNNQITDSVAGNVYLGVNAAVKVQDYTITAGKIANNLTYGSDLTITGNLTVQGNTTAIDTVNLVVEDPLILLAKEQTGAPALDIGFIGKRGTDENIAFVWDESADQFVAVFTNSEVTNSVININSYASLQVLDLTAANLDITGNIEFSGNIVGNVTVTGNVDAGNFNATSAVTAGTTVSATGNVSGGNITTGGLMSAFGNISGGNLNAVANITGGNVDVSSGVYSNDVIFATGNITGGNLITAGDMQSDTIHTTGNAVIGGNLIVQGNITYINIDDLRVEDPIIIMGTGANGVPPSVDDGEDRGIFMEYYSTAWSNAFVGWDRSANSIFAAISVDFSANNVVNVLEYGPFTAGNANLQSANVSGNVDGANVNATSGITAGTTIVATGNVSGGNITTAGVVETTGNVIGGNIVTTGIADLGNIRITGDDITNFASNIITINAAGSDIDLRVSGDTVANLLVTDAGTDTVLVGGGNATVNAAFKVDTTNSMMPPVGNTAQRPDVPVVGMIRFSTSNDSLEQYASTGWETVGTEFTVIVADAFVGDGVQTVFTLTEDSTTAGTIVAINGVLQEPTTAYAVAGNVLTFTEAPAVSDNIDARILTTTTTVAEIQNISGNAIVRTLESADTVEITGNILPATSNTFNLGSDAVRWKELFLEGSTITLGNVVIKNTGGNTVGFFGPDGTTPGAIDTNNIDSAGISNGTSSLQVIASGGNIRANVDGNTVGVFSSSGLIVTGSIEATNGFIGLDATSIANGTANVRTFEDANVTVSAGGNGNVMIVTATGANVTGTITATGNITGGNFVTTGNVQAGNLIVTGIEAVTTLNVSGDTLISGNLTVSGTTITANVASLVVTDPILGLGRGANGAPLTTNDGLDRGIEMFYYNTAERIAFMGFDNNEGKMLSAANVSIANNIVTVNSYGTTVVGTLETAGIVNTNANGVGNIGSSTTFFDTVFAKATSAQYADLAEMYEADAVYAPGTVLCFGGTREVTLCGQADSTRVAGVVSTNPSYLMNSGQTGDNVVAVALTGRVPCRVTGTIRKGDLMVAAGDGRARANNSAAVGTVIGKALADFEGADGTIEVVVGRV